MATTSVSARFQELFPETNLISLLTKYGGDADDIFETIQDRYDAHEQEPLVGLLGIKAANIDAFARAAYWDFVSDIRVKLAGLQTVPCLEMQADEQDSAILALIENIQRRDLHYLEEAAAIAAAADGLITHPENDDIDWTPDEFVSDWNDLHRGEEPLK